MRRAAAALAVAVVVGCSGGDGDDEAAPTTTTAAATTESSAAPPSGAGGGRSTTTEAETTTTADPNLVPVVDLGVGDCFDDAAVRADEPSQVQQVRLVDCAREHRNEVYASLLYESDDAAYPGNAVLAEFAQRECVAAFTGYVGAAVERTGYGIGTIYPDQPSWAAGDRVVLCVLYDREERPLTGSAKGTEG